MRLLVRFSSAAFSLAVATFIPTIGASHVEAAQKTSRCSTPGLVVWLNTQGDHAAGSSYYELRFTNLSGRTCTLRGFPGVAAVSIAGHQLGRAAARTRAGTSRQVRLPNNATAVATIQIANAHNFPTSACRPVVAAALRVYPPNQTASKLVPFPFPACSRAGPVYLFVRKVQKA
jgi:Domain of unknown function (DUF4232)